MDGVLHALHAGFIRPSGRVWIETQYRGTAPGAGYVSSVLRDGCGLKRSIVRELCAEMSFIRPSGRVWIETYLSSVYMREVSFIRPSGRVWIETTT